MPRDKKSGRRHRRTHHMKPEAIAKQKPPELPAGTHLKCAGVAVLGKDQITGMPMWFTYDGEENDHMNLSPSQPLIFPVGKLQQGTRVELFVPVPDDDSTH